MENFVFIKNNIYLATELKLKHNETQNIIINSFNNNGTCRLPNP